MSHNSPVAMHKLACSRLPGSTNRPSESKIRSSIRTGCQRLDLRAKRFDPVPQVVWIGGDPNCSGGIEAAGFSPSRDTRFTACAPWIRSALRKNRPAGRRLVSNFARAPSTSDPPGRLVNPAKDLHAHSASWMQRHHLRLDVPGAGDGHRPDRPGCGRGRAPLAGGTFTARLLEKRDELPADARRSSSRKTQVAEQPPGCAAAWRLSRQHGLAPGHPIPIRLPIGN